MQQGLLSPIQGLAGGGSSYSLSSQLQQVNGSNTGAAGAGASGVAISLTFPFTLNTDGDWCDVVSAIQLNAYTGNVGHGLSTDGTYAGIYAVVHAVAGYVATTYDVVYRFRFYNRGATHVRSPSQWTTSTGASSCQYRDFNTGRAWTATPTYLVVYFDGRAAGSWTQNYMHAIFQKQVP